MVDLTTSLDALVRDPGGAEAAVHAERVIGILGRRCPSDDEAAELLEHVTTFAAIGLGKRMLEALRRWRDDHPRVIRQMEVLLSVTEQPAAATNAFRRETELEKIQGVEVINAFMRGDLDGALSISRGANWFLDDVEAASGFIYGVWTLALQGGSDEAKQHVEAWRARNWGEDPRADHQLLRLEATLASYRADFDSEVRSLEEALFLTEEHGMGLEALFTDAALVAALAHVGDIDLAEERIGQWAPAEEGSLIDAYRHLAIADLSLLEGQWGRSLSAAQHVLEFYNVRRNPVLYQHIRFVMTLAATKSNFRQALDELAMAVRRLPTRRMMARVDDLEGLWRAGLRAPRTARITERTRRRPATRALPRLWYPTGASRADLFVDRVRRLVFVNGAGPLPLDDYPKRSQLLDRIASKPGFRVDIAELFSEVWKMPYDPSRHENKVHVTVHRLRKTLAGAGRRENYIHIADDEVWLAGDDIRVFESAGWDPPESMHIDERILHRLQTGPLSTQDLAEMLDVSRSTVLAGLNRLRAAGSIVRYGSGRSTVYQCVAADT